jgi:hypothetical protein
MVIKFRHPDHPPVQHPFIGKEGFLGGWPSLSRFLRRLGVFIRRSEGRWPIQALFDLEWGIPSSNGWSEHLVYVQPAIN